MAAIQRIRQCFTVLCLLSMSFSTVAVNAGVISKGAREAAEFLVKHFADDMAGESAEVVARRLSKLAARHGDEALAVVRRCGPRALRAVEEAGEHAPQAIRLLDSFGDDALQLIGKSGRLRLCAQYGDDAARAMMRHPRIAETAIRRFGKPAAKAFSRLSSRNGRRLAMMIDDGIVGSGPRAKSLLRVIEKYGDKACDFIWRNKGALATGAALAAFVNDPEAFFSGARSLAEVASAPVVEGVKEMAKSANGTIVLPLMAAITVVLIGMLCLYFAPKRALACIRAIRDARATAKETHPRSPSGEADASDHDGADDAGSASGKS